MDLIEPGFRPRYEKICVGNKGAEAQDVFFEGLLLEEGLGVYGVNVILSMRSNNRQAKISHGPAI
jgi:hypothetical protein